MSHATLSPGDDIAAVSANDNNPRTTLEGQLMKLRDLDEMTEKLRTQKAQIDGLLSELDHIKKGPLIDLRIASTVSPPVRHLFEIFDQNYAGNLRRFPHIMRNTIRRWREGRDPRLSTFVHVLATLGYTLRLEKTDEPRRDPSPLQSSPGQGTIPPDNGGDGPAPRSQGQT